MRWTTVILMVLALAFLTGCWSGRSKQTEIELARGEEESREIEEEVARNAELGDGTQEQLSAPRFAPEAGDMPLSGEVVDGVRVVKITARRYEFDPDQIVVNYGDRVRLEITSDNVSNGFALWGYGIDGRMEPHKTTTIEFQAQKAGEFHFACSEYSGPGWLNMRGSFYVKDPLPEKAHGE